MEHAVSRVYAIQGVDTWGKNLMSNTVSFVNQFSSEEQESALYSVWDQEYFLYARPTDLLFAAQIDSEVRRYLGHLSLCGYDTCLAVLKWTE